MSKKKKTLGSLRDQFKEAGLITAKQAKKADKGALRSELRIKKGIEVDEGKAGSDPRKGIDGKNKAYVLEFKLNQAVLSVTEE